MASKYYKCPFCSKKYVTKPSLYSHMESKHYEQLNGLSPAHYYFNYRNKKTHGSCIMCHKETPFNEETEKYERLCSQKCKEAYLKMFRERMKKKYGKETLLDDPEIQKKMLERRKISGMYTWSDGTKFKYVGTYEKDMLEYLDIYLHFSSQDVNVPAPQVFKYYLEDDDKEHFYMPDIFIVSLNLIIEVKGTNNHYQKRDEYIQEAKKKAVLDSKLYDYIIVFDKKYDQLNNLIEEIKDRNT